MTTKSEVHITLALMSERASRIVLGIEALLVCLPLTFLFLMAVLPSSFYFLAHSSRENDYASAGASLIILGTLFCAWLLIFSFTFNGSKALRKVSIYWWALPILTAGFAVVVTVNLWLASTIEPSAVNNFAWGVPFLIPLLHLCAERWWKSSANPLLNTDAPQEPRRAG